MSKQSSIAAAYDCTPDEWKADAWRLTLKFIGIMRQSGEKWTTESLRTYCHDRGLPERKGQAFGAIVQSLYRNGAIRKAGHTETSNPKAHSRLVQRWRCV